jgi:predicted RNase H-like nuclease (RuvC/YqgF family)
VTDDEKTEIRALIVDVMGGVAARLERHIDEQTARATSALRQHIDEQFILFGRRLSTLETQVVDLRMQVAALKDQMERFDRRLDYLVERTMESRTAEASDRQRLLAQITELRLRLDALESQLAGLGHA